MSGYRMERINADAERVIAEIVRSLKDPRIPEMTSVTAVRVTRDLKFAKVYVSVLGEEDVKALALTAFKAAAGHMRSQLAEKLDLRNTPQLIFERDDSIEHMSKIDGILKDLHKGE